MLFSLSLRVCMSGILVVPSEPVIEVLASFDLNSFTGESERK